MKDSLSNLMCLAWLFLEPPALNKDRKCIVVGRFKACHRPFVYDGICSWHWNVGKE